MWKQSREEGIEKVLFFSFQHLPAEVSAACTNSGNSCRLNRNKRSSHCFGTGHHVSRHCKTSYQKEEIISQLLISQMIYILFPTRLFLYSLVEMVFHCGKMNKEGKREEKLKTSVNTVRASCCLANRLHCWLFGCINKVQKLRIGPWITVLICERRHTYIRCHFYGFYKAKILRPLVPQTLHLYVVV